MKVKKTLLSINETAELLGICSQTLRNWEKRENFPFNVHYTLGGHRRYAVSEIEDFLSEKSQQSNEREVVHK